ncbi:hypothetical protein DNTS_016195 [Danionella cerebrum]|uniref:G-protein coupled receptors family 1 profile domain-containing protein n=1 Tax=Danionella cerebrum TaxID=2873325 RepID=A0A553Q0H8_9TELE|nr:hypothetical protein DNTS_016195 [Danionella translucida]
MRSNSSVLWEQAKNTTLHDGLAVGFVVVNCVVLLVALHVGIVANLFVAWAVYHQKSLRTSNNALLVSLAVIDILRCAIDCPLLLSIVIHAGAAQDFGLVFCSVQIASFSLISCVQLLTLACISAERYQAIAYPFKSAERRKRIMVWIPLTWLIPIAIAIICVIFAKDSPVYVRCRSLRTETLVSYDTFGFYILTPVWCVCFAVIVGFYGRIFLLVRAHGRKIFDKGSFPPPDKKPTVMEITTKDLNPVSELPTTVANVFDSKGPDQRRETQEEFCEPPIDGLTEHNLQDLFEGRSQTADDVSERSATGPGSVEPTESTESRTGNTESEQDTQQDVPTETNEEDDSPLESNAPESPESLCEQELPEPREDAAAQQEKEEVVVGAVAGQQEEEEVVGAVCMMPSLAQRERGNAKKESKLAKRSGYIILTFLIFWIPLIISVVLNHFDYGNDELTLQVLQELEILSVSLVCVTSVTNPIIYAAVNPQFRTEFHGLLRLIGFTRC